MYHYRSFIEDLFHFNLTAKSSHLSASLYDLDKAGKMDALDNSALLRRAKFTEDGKSVDMMGRLHCDIFSQSKYILNEVDIRITLSRNRPEICLMAAANTEAVVQIENATLFVRKATINPSILLAHARTLNQCTAKYPYKRVEIHSVTLSQGTRQQNLENLFLGKVPSRLIIGMVTNSAFSGDISKNPFNFQHFNLNNLSVVVNGQQITSKPLTPNFNGKSQSYIIPYICSFYGSGNHLVDDGYDVDRVAYANGYTLFPFDLNGDLSANSTHWSPQREGNIRLEVNFDVALTEAITVILYAEFREVLEIDRHRTCSLEYKEYKR